MFTQLLNSQVSYKRSDQWNSRSWRQLTQQCNADTYVRTHVPYMTHASVIVNSYNVPTLFSRQSLGNRIAVLDICTQWYLPGTAAGGGGGGGWLHWKLQVWQIWLPVWASDWRWSKPPIRSYTLVTSSGKHLFWQYRNMWKGATKTVLKPKWVILYSFQKVWQTYICQLPPTTETFSAQDFLVAFVKKIKEGAPCILSSVLGCSRYKFYTTQW